MATAARTTAVLETTAGARPAAIAKLPTRKIPSGELARIRELLAHKKRLISSHLQTELSELEKPEKRHRADLEEIASDTHDTDSLCEIMDIEVTQIDQIDTALSKIDNGTYGICEDCGGEIPLARLEALPFASQCIACKRRAEISGRIDAASDSAASF
jgi:DnaK suppressor protein